MGRLFGMLLFLLLAGGAIVGGYMIISGVRTTTGAGEDHTYQGAPTHLVIGIDLSQSNVLVTNSAFARKVADRIRPMIEDLPPRSKVTLRTFGSYDSRSNPLRGRAGDWRMSELKDRTWIGFRTRRQMLAFKNDRKSLQKPATPIRHAGPARSHQLQHTT